MFAAVVALALAAQAVPPRRPDEQTLADFLWYDHPFGQGRMACDKMERRRQQSDLDRRFKRRIARLRLAYEAVNGADAPIDVIALLTCTRDPAKVDSAFRQGTKAFDIKLRAFETRYGVTR